MSVLVHDLRGPLTVAKMGSAMLVDQPKMLNERPELAAKIDTNIDRVERMIRDLLDTNRIRANERLPLHLAEIDLAALAREVIQDLSPINYARFILKLEDGVRGTWDAEKLRRALWNLAINAVKYGAPDKPITITVKRSGSETQISVHNYGSVIAPEDQAYIFDSFTRTQDAQTKGKIGWGLGLTLVRGCSEAHGGRVTVESSTTLGRWPTAPRLPGRIQQRLRRSFQQRLARERKHQGWIGPDHQLARAAKRPGLCSNGQHSSKALRFRSVRDSSGAVDDVRSSIRLYFDGPERKRNRQRPK